MEKWIRTLETLFLLFTSMNMMFEFWWGIVAITWLWTWAQSCIPFSEADEKNRALDKQLGGRTRRWWDWRDKAEMAPTVLGDMDRSWQLPLGQNCQNPNNYKDAVWLKSYLQVRISLISFVFSICMLAKTEGMVVELQNSNNFKQCNPQCSLNHALTPTKYDNRLSLELTR